MDIRFCVHYKGDGYPPSNRYCRACPEAHLACDALWARVVELSQSNNGGAVPLAGTRAEMYPNTRNPLNVRMKINCRWYLPKEDFLYFIATGHAGMGPERPPRRQKSVPEHDPAGAVRAGDCRSAWRGQMC